jgi:hypothetical protein
MSRIVHTYWEKPGRIPRPGEWVFLDDFEGGRWGVVDTTHGSGDRRYEPGRKLNVALAERVLTVMQPSAWAIVAGLKNIENRPRQTHLRGPILIHAGLRWDTVAGAWMGAQRIDVPDAAHVHGAIIGGAIINDCVRDAHQRDPERVEYSRWAIPGFWHWALRGATAFPRPIEARGRQGWWPAPALGARYVLWHATAPAAAREVSRAQYRDAAAALGLGPYSAPGVLIDGWGGDGQRGEVVYPGTDLDERLAAIQAKEPSS